MNNAEVSNQYQNQSVVMIVRQTNDYETNVKPIVGCAVTERRRAVMF